MSERQRPEENRPILTVSGLHTSFHTEEGEVRAVEGVSFQMKAGETLGIVGESGSGKSVTMLSIMGLLPKPPAEVSAGKALYHGACPSLAAVTQETVALRPGEVSEASPPGIDLLALSERQLRRVRGNQIAMIFQDPMTSLNPFLRIKTQLNEVLRLHKRMSHKLASAESVEMLRRVGIPDPEKVMLKHPHQLSGGMRQRVMIAMALLCRPTVLIADEPTTALDVTIQAQILELIKQLRDQLGTSVVMITHDLGVVAGIADHVMVMYAGSVMEEASCEQLFDQPQHPYTLALLRSIPKLHIDSTALYAIPGLPPDLANKPPGCPFEPRCQFSRAVCCTGFPPIREHQPGHRVACWLEEAPQ